MRARSCVLALTVAFATLAMAMPAAQQGYDIYQQALVKERAAGELDAAIALYERVVKEFAADRVLAAKALMRMAGCYEQLGSPEAGKIYERVVDQFADQVDAAAEARRRLRPISAPSLPPALPTGLVRLAREPLGRIADIPAGTLSPNGRYVAFTTGDVDLELRDVATGKTKRLATAAAGARACGGPFAWSRDSTKVAFVWCLSNSSAELRTIDVTSAAVRTIGPTSVSRPVPLDWSPDGRTLLVLFQARPDPGSNQLAIVSVADGVARPLKTAPSALGRWPVENAARFSPDGLFVVYTPDTGERGIFRMAVENGDERPVLASGNHELFLGWTPSGRIVFQSDRLGTLDLLIAAFVDGPIQGGQGKLVTDVGPITPVALTDSGAFFYTTPLQQRTSITDLYLAPVDPETGKASGSALPVSRSGAGHLTYPVWSPDSHELAYKVGPAGTAGSIFIQSLESGQERSVGSSLGSVAQFDWSRDGRSIVVATARNNVLQIVRVDVKTGQTAIVLGGTAADVVPPDSSPGRGALSQPRWMPDGHSILFSSGATVERRDVDTGDQRTVVNLEGQEIQSLAVAPDGKSVAFSVTNAVMVAALTGAQPRVLVTISSPNATAKRVTWSADGRYVIYADRTAAAMVPGTKTPYTELWRISAEGGRAERLGVAADSIIQPAMSPDGQYLAFSVNADIRPGVHVLDGFLPSSELVRIK